MMKTRGRVCVLALALLALSVEAAGALQVPDGCDAPPDSGHGQTFFVDPARGDKGNDGSEQRPWRTLAEVLDPSTHLVATRAYIRFSDGLGPPAPVNSAGPIRPGDTIVLLSGDHGEVNAPQYVNSNFISVVAGKDQSPLVRSLHLWASSHWLFRGVKFQAVKTESDQNRPLVAIESHSWAGPSDNIIIVDSSFSTEDDARGWTDKDWVNKPYDPGFASSARCMTLLNNHFFNLRDAIQITGDQSLIQGNLIEDIGNDGIDIIASDLVVRGNQIRNGHHTPVEQLHADGIQGWTYPRDATNRNVVIDSNSIINLNPANDTYLQGISIFDGKWDGLTVTNNVVITNAWHGIALYGVTNAVVVNNTVAAARPDLFTTWLMIHDSKGKTPSRNVLVRNNITVQILAQGDGLTVDHNIAEKKIEFRSGEQLSRAIHGTVGDHNTVVPDIFNTFVDYDLAKGRFDLRPGPRSLAAGAGNGDRAPSLDIAGRRRVDPVDIGAYAR